MWHLLFFVWAIKIEWEDPKIYFCQEAVRSFDSTETLNNYKAWEWWKSKLGNGFIQRWIINRLLYKQTQRPIMIFHDPEPADEGDMITCAAQVQEQ